jgi:cytochrome b561
VVLTRSYLALAVTRGLWVCLVPELPAQLLMSPLTSGVASWRHCLLLFLSALAPSLAPWTATSGDASPLLIRAG